MSALACGREATQVRVAVSMNRPTLSEARPRDKETTMAKESEACLSFVLCHGDGRVCLPDGSGQAVSACTHTYISAQYRLTHVLSD